MSFYRPTGRLEPTPADLAYGSLELAALEYQARRGEIILLYEDETILWRFALPRAGWWRKAQRARLPTRPLSQSQIKREETLKRQTWLRYRSWSRITSGVLLSVLGAVQYGTSKVFYKIVPHFDAQELRQYLHQVMATFSKTGQEVVMVVDRSGIHRAHKLDTTFDHYNGKVRFHFLPAHCGHHLNPIEGFWRVMKDAIGAGRSFAALHLLYQRTRHVLMAHQEAPSMSFTGSPFRLVFCGGCFRITAYMSPVPRLSIRAHFLRPLAGRRPGGIHASSIDGYRKISPRTYCPVTGPPPILRASQGRRITVLSHSTGHMRPTTSWGLGMGLLSLCHLVTLPHRLGAEETSPERLVVAALCQALPSRCPLGAGQTTADDLWTLAGLMLPPAASAPPEDPLTSDCQYLGFQTEWVASKRDAGLPLGEAWLASQRVFARDLPWQDALAGALGTLVYRAPQRSPTELRQAMEAACLAQPLRWAERRFAW